MKQNDTSKAGAFRALHQPGSAFVIPNPWDRGTARILTEMGFSALATTSAGHAFSLGKKDGQLSRAEALAHCAEIVESTDLPVSADLENGFGDDPEEVVETINGAAASGLAGCSIEDYKPNEGGGIYERSLAVERVEAAVEARDRLEDDFVLTARCENFLRGNPDLDDTISRLQDYAAAGADVLYAPGLTKLEMIRAVCEAVDKPVNVLMGFAGATFGRAELAELGVSRISVGSAMARAAFGAFVRSATEIVDHGTFTFANDAISFADIESWFEPRNETPQ